MRMTQLVPTEPRHAETQSSRLEHPVCKVANGHMMTRAAAKNQIVGFGVMTARLQCHQLGHNAARKRHDSVTRPMFDGADLALIEVFHDGCTAGFERLTINLHPIVVAKVCPAQRSAVS